MSDAGTGLLLSASFDSEWCKLPITVEDAQEVKSFRHNATHFRRVPMGSGHGGSDITTVIKIRDLVFPNTTIQWHTEDALLSDTSLPIDEICKWL